MIHSLIWVSQKYWSNSSVSLANQHLDSPFKYECLYLLRIFVFIHLNHIFACSLSIGCFASGGRQKQTGDGQRPHLASTHPTSNHQNLTLVSTQIWPQLFGVNLHLASTHTTSNHQNLTLVSTQIWPQLFGLNLNLTSTHLPQTTKTSLWPC